MRRLRLFLLASGVTSCGLPDVGSSGRLGLGLTLGVTVGSYVGASVSAHSDPSDPAYGSDPLSGSLPRRRRRAGP